jgi:hypothetical protein
LLCSRLNRNADKGGLGSVVAITTLMKNRVKEFKEFREFRENINILNFPNFSKFAIRSAIFRLLTSLGRAFLFTYYYTNKKIAAETRGYFVI